MLWSAAPAAAALGFGMLPSRAIDWSHGALAAFALLGFLAGLWLEARPSLARSALALGTAAGLSAMHSVLLRSPAAVVVAAAILSSLYLFAFLDPPIAPETHPTPPGPAGTARVALLAAVVACGSVLMGNVAPLALACAGLSSLAAIALAARWSWRGEGSRWSRGAVAVACLAGIAGAVASLDAPYGAAAALGAGQLVGALLLRADARGEQAAWGGVFEHPARVLVATFAALCALGTLILALPVSSESGTSIGFVDAAFTAVSAVCVTGLIVLDTPNAFTNFGEAAILGLIQIGGLGIMTFYTVALAALGRRMSLRHERALAGAMNIEERNRLVGSVGRVLLVTVVAELAGALALAAAFVRHGDSVGVATWRGVFTSISAFCNAGFALQTDSLVHYQSDPVIVHVVAALIIVGGLSPAAVVVVPRWISGRRIDVQPATILWTSTGLLIVGALGYGLMEWTVSLGHLPWYDRLHNAWFQSVTLRTAGFNTVDLTETRSATRAMMMVFMFIGGSPGGTAGGVKTTTAAVLVLTVAATLRGREQATAFGRRVGHRTVYKAAAVVTVGVLAVFAALIAIELTQAMDAEVAVFEIVSALGTVGLSIGGTAALDDVGEVLVMACMFAGRVGPLTLFLFLTERRIAQARLVYPEAEIDVG